ncbi:MAG: hypothetical protein CM1200mP36_11500 [Gammaproteobacteria bacterium]|nr:MAG: hypothetical protein CM1200mP36_11500 [Gammaproteobacteria bacterium]
MLGSPLARYLRLSDGIVLERTSSHCNLGIVASGYHDPAVKTLVEGGKVCELCSANTDIESIHTRICQTFYERFPSMHRWNHEYPGQIATRVGLTNSA